MIYVIFGSEPLLVKNTLKKTVTNILETPDEFNYRVLSAGTNSLIELSDEVHLLPLGAEQKVVVFENADWLDERGHQENVPSDLKDFMQNESENVTLIVTILASKINRKNPLISIIPDSAKYLEIQDITSATWPELIRRTVSAKGATIDGEAVKELSERVGNDITRFVHEADKLCAYTSHIRREDVEILVARPLEERAYLLTGALLHHNLKTALSLLKDLYIQNQQPVVLTVLLANQFRLYAAALYLSERGNSIPTIASELKLHPYRTERMIADSRGESQQTMLNRLEQLYQFDLAVKSGQIDARAGFELLLIKLCI